MARAYRARFPHRRNNDGTFDSICPDCSLSVARGLRTEAELVPFEALHDCPISYLAERGVLRDRSKNNGDDPLAAAS